MRGIVSLLCTFALLACGSRDAAHASGEREASPTASDAPAGEGTAALEGIRVRATVQRGGEIELAVDHRGGSTVRLRPTVRVEHSVDGSFRPLDVSGLSLRADCATPPPECIELAAGGGLRPPAWNGRSGAGQCVGASAGSAAPNGTYRVVVTSCDGSARATSEPFTIQR